jgi:hypothetical protein
MGLGFLLGAPSVEKARTYYGGFAEALEGHRPYPPMDVQRVIRGSCDEQAHYFRGHRDGRKHRGDLQRDTRTV